MNQTIGHTALCLAMLCSAALAGPSAKDIAAAEAFLVKSLNDSDKLPLVLIGLRSTKDASLAPLFSALMSHPDRNVRMLATASATQASGKLAIPALKARLAKDPSMVIRTRALLELDALKAMSTAELAATLKLADRIVVIESGRVTQEGTHRDLLESEGLYRDLCLIQGSLEDDLRRQVEEGGTGE